MRDVFAPGASLRWDELVTRATGEPLTAAHLARELDAGAHMSFDLGLRGRAAVVAGGTRGVGRATADLLAGEGCRVAVLARTEPDLRETEDELLTAGAIDAVGLQCDLLDTGEVEAAFTFLDERWGECHALVNTVGPAHVGGLPDLTDNEWLDEFDLGVLTMVRTTRAALPLLRKATFARVVNVAASSIRHQSPGLIGFTAAKAAMASASKNLSRALAPEGIIVNTVAPGHGDVAHAGRLPRGHRPHRPARRPARGRLRGHRPRLRRRERHRPGGAARRRSRRWSSSSARSCRASWWAPPSPLTAAPISSDVVSSDLGFF